MATHLSNMITALRRRRSLIGGVLAWLFVMQTVLGGLAMARMLPEQQVALLTGTSLCQPGESGAPASPSENHQDCIACPHMSAGPCLPATGLGLSLAMPAGFAIADAQPRQYAPPNKPDVRSIGPRAPPPRA